MNAGVFRSCTKLDSSFPGICLVEYTPLCTLMILLSLTKQDFGKFCKTCLNACTIVQKRKSKIDNTCSHKRNSYNSNNKGR